MNARGDRPDLKGAPALSDGYDPEETIALLRRELEYYRREHDVIGARMLSLQEDQSRTAREARRSRTLAKLVRDAYRLVDRAADAAEVGGEGGGAAGAVRLVDRVGRAEPRYPRLMRSLLLILSCPFQRARIQLERAYRAKQLERTIDAVRATHTRFARHGLTHQERIWNLALYLLLLESDLEMLKYDGVLALTKRRRSFVARLLAVQLYEAYQDLAHLMGKDLRESLGELGAGDETMAALGALAKRLNQLKRKHQADLKEVRNVAGAHRDKDAALQWRMVDETSLASIMEASAELYTVIREFAAFLTMLGTAAGQPGVVLQQYLRNPEATMFPAEE